LAKARVRIEISSFIHAVFSFVRDRRAVARDGPSRRRDVDARIGHAVALMRAHEGMRKLVK